MCGDGYTLRQKIAPGNDDGYSTKNRAGDIPGSGKVNGKGGGRKVDNIEVCRALCDSESACNSFEYKWSYSLSNPHSSADLCNLNKLRLPTDQLDAYSGWVFCAKGDDVGTLLLTNWFIWYVVIEA